MPVEIKDMTFDKVATGPSGLAAVEIQVRGVCVGCG